MKWISNVFSEKNEQDFHWFVEFTFAFTKHSTKYTEYGNFQDKRASRWCPTRRLVKKQDQKTNNRISADSQRLVDSKYSHCIPSTCSAFERHARVHPMQSNSYRSLQVHKYFVPICYHYKIVHALSYHFMNDLNVLSALFVPTICLENFPFISLDCTLLEYLHSTELIWMQPDAIQINNNELRLIENDLWHSKQIENAAEIVLLHRGDTKAFSTHLHMEKLNE